MLANFEEGDTVIVVPNEQYSYLAGYCCVIKEVLDYGVGAYADSTIWAKIITPGACLEHRELLYNTYKRSALFAKCSVPQEWTRNIDMSVS